MASNCDRLRNELVAFDRGELDGPDEVAVREHVASCAACSRELARLRRTVELVAGATAIEPTPAASARLRGVLDEALVAAAAERAPVHGLSLGRRVRESWDELRARYRRSASFRRFTLASVGLHAAAAVVVGVLLARSSDAPERPVAFRVAPGETAFTLPETTPSDGSSELEGTASLFPIFDAASPDGVAAAGLPFAVFPNATTAARWGVSATAESRRAALQSLLAGEAAAAEVTIDRGLAWLAAQRRSDGAWLASGTDRPSAATTAAAVHAFAGGGRSSVEDPGLAQSVAWLERNADTLQDFEDRAHALRALTAQLVTDYRHLAYGERARRTRIVAMIAARLEGDANRDEGAARDMPRALATVAALADARVAGIHDGARGLAALVRRIEGKRSPDGRLTGETLDEGVLFTAELAEIAADAGARPFADEELSSLGARLTAASGVSTRDAARAASALAALGRSVRDPVASVVRSQRADGAWDDAASGQFRPDATATAYGVLAVTRAFRR